MTLPIGFTGSQFVVKTVFWLGATPLLQHCWKGLMENWLVIGLGLATSLPPNLMTQPPSNSRQTTDNNHEQTTDCQQTTDNPQTTTDNRQPLVKCEICERETNAQMSIPKRLEMEMCKKLFSRHISKQ